MQGWITGFQESINFIEQNLTEELNNEELSLLDSCSMCSLWDRKRKLGFLTDRKI